MSDPLSQDTLSDAELRRIRILKTIVVTLGILIVLGVLGLAAGLVYRANKLGENEAGSVQTEKSARSGQLSVVDIIELSLPSDAAVKTIDLDGATIALHWANVDGKEAIWIVDLNTGRVSTRIELK